VTLFKTLVDIVDGLDGQTGMMDTISWRDKLWLVPRWQLAKTEGYRQPVRIIRPRLYQFARPKLPEYGENYSLSVAVPKAVLDGELSSEDAKRFVIVEAPAIEIPFPTVQ
jgi:hypothetical protein